jgi:hypothetical protein
VYVRFSDEMIRPALVTVNEQGRTNELSGPALAADTEAASTRIFLIEG